MRIVCVECGEPVLQDYCWNEVIGWEHKRYQGGTNHISLRKKTGKLMCSSCMMKLQAGVAAGQMTL